jgi:hypothetical protein
MLIFYSFEVYTHIDLYPNASLQVLVLSPNDQIFITVWQLRSCFCGAPFLTRGWVCLLYMLLALASAVFLGSVSLGTRDHILLSQICDFLLCRLLQLAGSQWRYSTPPPHGFCFGYSWESVYSRGRDDIERISSQSHIATDGQSVSKTWCRAPSVACDQIFNTVWQLRSCFLWGALSDERTGLSFIRVISCVSKSFVIM